jgi:hypothetical protein
MDVGGIISTTANWIAASWPYVGPLVAALGGYWLAERHAERADRRARRDAKLARMRASLERLVLSAWAMQTASVEMISGIAGETKQQKETRLNEMLREAATGINEARARLALESGGDQFNSQYQKVHVAFYMFMLHTSDRQSGDDTAKPTEKRQELEAEVKALDRMAKDAIEQMEKSA